MDITIRLYRLFFACLIIIAVIAQFLFKLSLPNFSVINFFSYFTILSNIFAASVFFILLLKPKVKNLEEVRGAAVFYMAITGVVYAILLSKYESTPGLMLPFANTVLHKIMPIVMVLDWIFVPKKRKIPYRVVFTWLVFPVIFLLYSELRGNIISWYPYPFLDPKTAGGYKGVIEYSISILLFAILLGFMLIYVKRLRIK